MGAVVEAVRRLVDRGVPEIVLTGEDSWAERDLERFFGEGAAELGAEDLLGPDLKSITRS